jgi:selenide,water dikinase
MVGIDTRDDSGVYLLSENSALIQTVDFFTPVVDDPYDFGQIAVANSLSDIYAMGAMPLTALNIVGFPVSSMDKSILAQILKGGWDKANQAGVAIVGGHSVKDPEIKYGLAVTAVADPGKILKNSTAMAGDKLILTKALGTGILTTALKNDKLPDDILNLITESMKKLNKLTVVAMMEFSPSACTDVTGFGFMGHLYEMMNASNKTAVIETAKIPVFPEVEKFVKEKQIPGGLKENLQYLLPNIDKSSNISEERLKILCDPQTSGGLIISIAENYAEACFKKIRDNGDDQAEIVGEVTEPENIPIILK